MSYKTQIYLERIKKLYDGKLEVLSDKIDTHWYVKVRFDCGHEGEFCTKYVLSGKLKCSICNHKNRMSQEEFRDRFNSRYGNEFELKSDYVGYRRPVIVEHKECGREFLALPNNFVPKNAKLSCPYCRTTKGRFYDKFAFVEEFRKGELDLDE